jgi:hypothetical protein
MKIQSIYFFLLLILFSNSSFSQINLDTLDDGNRISIQSYIPPQVEGLTPIIESQLKNMLNQIIVKNGFGNNSADNRFILTPHIDILSKEITSTAPSMHVFTLQVTLYIADGIDGTLFSSYTKTVKGVGQNETKAYISALGNMKNLDAEYTEFIEKGKNKILDYYNSRCQFILSEANSKAEKREFDEAMASLVAIPSVCKDCYAKALDLSVDIFKKKLDFSCDQSMTQAKAAIAQNKWEEAADFISLYTPDVSCYPEVLKILTEITNHQCAIQLGGAKGAWATRDTEAAAEFLSKIPTDSDCAADAKIMMQNISANLDAIEKKKWDLAYEKYNRGQVLNETKVKSDIDLKKREMSFKEKQLYDLKKRQIQSAKEVGLAFAKNKSKNIIYNLRDWWR